MDPELIAYFDRHFSETSQQIFALREETSQQISALREETSQQISALREETSQQISALREDMVHRFEQADDTNRQSRILVEDLRRHTGLIAEGYIGVNEKLDRFQSEATLVFDEVKGWIEPYYRNLDGRVRVLEGRVERQQGDVYDAISKLARRPPVDLTSE